MPTLGAMRVLVVARFLVLVAVYALMLVRDGGILVNPAAYLLVFALGLVNVGYVLFLPYATRLREFVLIQLVIDGVVEAVLIYLTGGVYSFAVVLMLGSVVAASLTVSPRAGIAYAAASVVVLGAVQLSYHLLARGAVGGLPWVQAMTIYPARLLIGRDVALLIAQSLGLFAVGGLSARLQRHVSGVRGLYREIIERMAEGLLVVDGDGLVLFFNASARELLLPGVYLPLVGEPVEELLAHVGSLPLSRWLQATGVVTEDVELQGEGGVPVTVQVRTSVVRQPTGQLVCTIVTLVDVSSARQVQSMRERAERLEELAMLSMGIAHEVRNPLASIRGCAQELAAVAELATNQRRFLEIICSESDRMDTMVEQFAQFARTSPMRTSTVDLRAFLDTVATGLRQREVAVIAEIIVEAGNGLSVQADPDMLHQVVVNLAINGLDAIDRAGSGRLSLRASRSPGDRDGESGWVAIEVEDTGVGMDEATKQKVFRPFFSTKSRGMGLGLALVARMVRLHGGTIHVRSSLGKGATVTVRLPVAAASVVG